VFIEFFRGNLQVTVHFEELLRADSLLTYSPVTLAEIYRGIRSNEKAEVETILSAFECLPLNQEVGRRAGDYLKKYARSHGIEVADALIAATAVIHKVQLCTFNWKHYPMGEIRRFRIDR
ncbi:MAG TPA: hypothetical protein DF383_03705, partial [Deltaproteobacteria bacterium]|nr:hypothetical protein [Deltaproteobacteria bacterium]